MVTAENCTGLILAGGKSSRMGQNKALMVLEGKTLLQRQAEKFRRIGVRQILISGPEALALPGIPAVPDRYPDCGPIGGLQAGMAAAATESCIVLGVDWPLVPAELLEELMAVHRGGVTVLRHAGGEEPLLGIYDRCAEPLLRQMIAEGVYSVRRLEQRMPVARYDYTGPAELLRNCNTPADIAWVRTRL